MEKSWNILMVGAGTMGRGIAEVFAAKGLDITLYDAFPEQFEKAKKFIIGDMEYFKSEELITDEEIENVHKHIFYEADLEKIAPKVNLVIEGVFENHDVKRDIYEKLNKLCTPDCILLSNTSGSNIFEIAEVSNPERLLIAHFFNPPYVMPLVELVMGPSTSDEIVEEVKNLFISVGKDPAVLRHYVPGFIVNRLDQVLQREIGYMISQGWTTGADVERAIKYTSGIRYSFEGPLSLHDVVGWDITTAVSKDVFETLCNDVGEDKHGRQLIEQGRLGIKTGKGVYDYTGIDIQDYMNKRSHKIVTMLKAVKSLENEK